jgi:catecholate siderophore receptor
MKTKPLAQPAFAPIRAYAKPPLAATALGALLLPLWAQAQEPAPSNPTEIHVQASRQSDPNSTADTYNAPYTTVGRTPSAIRDVPQATTSITRRVIEERDANSLKEALYNAPGITFNASEGGNSGDGIVMRGFSASNDIFLDNFRDAAQYNRDTFNLDRVEVLRGPSSMLYGKGSTGGVINQVSKTPFQSDLYSLTGTVGSYGFKRVEGDFNKGLSDTAGLRVNVMKQQANSYRAGAEQNRWGIAPSVKFGIGTPTEITASYLRYEEDNVPDYGVPIIAPTLVNAPNPGTPIPRTDRFYGLTALDREQNRNHVFSLDINHRFDGRLSLHNATRVGNYKTDLRATAPGLQLRPGETPASYVYSDTSPVVRSRKLRLREQDIRSNQTELNARFDTGSVRHEALLGVELTRETVLITGRAYPTGASCTLPTTTVGGANPDVPVNCPPLVHTSYGDVTADTRALFTQDLINLDNQWKLLVGGRFDRFRTAVQTRPQTGANAGKVIDVRERTETVWSGRAGLIWQPDSTQSYYAAVGSSFNPSAEAYALDPLGANTPPEKNRNYELGAKWDLFEKQLALRTALFRTVKTNERQTDVTNTTPADDYLLSGQRSTTGVELEAAGQITDAWQVFAGLAFMRPRIDQSNRAGNVGKTPPNAPRYTVNLWTTYQLDAHWKLGFGGNAVGKRYADRYSNGSPLANDRWLPGYVRWDASVEYAHRNLSAQLNLYNLADKRYYEAYYPAFATPGMARSARLSVTYKFW